MDGRDVVVLPAGERPGRVAARLRERGVDATVPDGAVAPALAGSDPDLVACLDTEGASALELLAAVREADASVPAVLVAAGDERTSRLAAVAGEAAVATVSAGDGGPPPVDALASAVEGQVTGETPDATAPVDVQVERERYLTMLDQLPDPVLITSFESAPVIRYVNAAFEEQFGYAAEEARGRRVEDLLVPAEPDAEMVGLSEREEGAIVERTVRRQTADGVGEFLFRGFRTTIGGGPEAFVVYTDVTERQRRARRLNALHGTARDLLTAEDAASVAEVTVDAASDILDLPATGVYLADDAPDRLEPAAWSGAVAELFGEPPTYTPEDDLVWDVYEAGEARVIDDIDAADDVDRETPVRSAMLLPLGDHGVFISSGERPREFDDETVDLARLLAANAEAALTRAANVSALRERERRLRALFENIPIPAVNVEHRDGSSIVLEVNPAFEETFGYDAAEIVGEDIDDFVTPEDRSDEAAAIASQASSGAVLSQEVKRRTADGLRDFLLTTVPVEPGAEDGRAYGFYIDITERQQRQQRLRVLSRVLRHDIRNQVTLIEGSADRIADRADDPGTAAAACDVAEAARELAAIGRKTRIVERTQVGAEPGEVSTAARVVQGAVAPVQESFPAASVEVDVPTNAPVGSAEAVALAVRELVENAVVHHDGDQPRVRVRGRTTDEGFLELAVTDDGPGIPDEERAVLTGERQPTQLEHGSGLGLWMARWVVAGVGGEFDIRERDGGGTVVELSVPLAAEEA